MGDETDDWHDILGPSEDRGDIFNPIPCPNHGGELKKVICIFPGEPPKFYFTKYKLECGHMIRFKEGFEE